MQTDISNFHFYTFSKVSWQHHHNFMWYHFKCSFRISTTNNLYIYILYFCLLMLLLYMSVNDSTYSTIYAQKHPSYERMSEKFFFIYFKLNQLSLFVCCCLFGLFALFSDFPWNIITHTHTQSTLIYSIIYSWI